MKRRSLNINPLDVGILLALIGAGSYLAYRITVGLHYTWNWRIIPQYLFRYDAQRGGWTTNLLMQGFLTTVRLSIWTTLLATVLGTVMGLFRCSSSMFRRMVGRTYVEAARNLPPLVLVFIVYFFLSDQMMTALHVDDFIRSRSPHTQAVFTVLLAPPSQFAAFLSALMTLALYEGAYITEIIRAGIQSIERGQWESSAALGLSWSQQMRHIILPQAIQRILPALAGQFISTIKDSSIVSVISIQELTFQGMQVMAATYLTIEIWLTITALYFVLTFSCSILVGQLERSLRRSRI